MELDHPQYFEGSTSWEIQGYSMNQSYIPCRNCMKFNSFQCSQGPHNIFHLPMGLVSQSERLSTTELFLVRSKGSWYFGCQFVDGLGRWETLSKWWWWWWRRRRRRWLWQWWEELKLLSAHVGTCSWTIYMVSCHFCFFMLQVPSDSSFQLVPVVSKRNLR